MYIADRGRAACSGGAGGASAARRRDAREAHHTVVVGVRDEQRAAARDRQSGRPIELSRTAAAVSPAAQQVAVGTELLDAVVAGVGDEHVAARVDSDPVRAQQSAGPRAAFAPLPEE